MRPRDHGDPLPDPLIAGLARRLRGAIDAGYREALEALLAALPGERAATLAQLTRESRGTWALLLSGCGGEALHVGSPLSGAVVPLAAAGYRVTLLDTSRERLELAVRIASHQVPGKVRGVLGRDDARLPFADRAFDVVVHDDERAPAPGPELLSELRRVCASELVVTGDNRLGYKRSSGRAWDWRVPSPLEYARAVARPRAGERTLRAWRRALRAADFEEPRALALYPDRRDFAQVIALDEPLPRLVVGPNEARNRLKVAAHALGAFPAFTPSFAFLARRRGSAAGPPLLERVLRELAERTGEPVPAVEHLVGSRGNNALVMTAVPGAPADDPRGRWVLHVPLHLGHRAGLALHVEMLRRVRREHAGVPVPEALFFGELCGLTLSCERRLAGFASNHALTSRERADRVLHQIAGHLAQLVLEPARALDENEYDALVGPWFEGALHAIDDADLRRELERRRASARAELAGRVLPRMLAHGDLRAKHVQVDDALRVVGYLDWGTVAEPSLPGLDLVHRIVHDRKQMLGQRDAHAWRDVLALELAPGERAALERYAAALGIELRDVIDVAELYPAHLTAIVDRFTPYVPRDWYRAHFVT